jgi:hypothetical protein
VIEYQVTVPTWTSPNSTFVVSPSIPGAVYSYKLQDYDNYPRFYSATYRPGYALNANSGEYTCYKRGHNYKPWSYVTRAGDLGIGSEVIINNEFILKQQHYIISVIRYLLYYIRYILFVIIYLLY